MDDAGAGIVGRGKGRSWSCAVCVHEQGQGWVSSLPACFSLLPSASNLSLAVAALGGHERGVKGRPV